MSVPDAIRTDPTGIAVWRAQWLARGGKKARERFRASAARLGADLHDHLLLARTTTTRRRRDDDGDSVDSDGDGDDDGDSVDARGGARAARLRGAVNRLSLAGSGASLGETRAELGKLLGAPIGDAALSRVAEAWARPRLLLE